MRARRFFCLLLIMAVLLSALPFGGVQVFGVTINIPIYVDTGTENIELSVENNETIEDIKQKIQALTGIPANKFFLGLGPEDILMLEDHTVEEECFYDGTTLYMYVPIECDYRTDALYCMDLYVPYNKATSFNPEDVFWDGHRFIGWNTKEDGTGTNYTVGMTITLTEPLQLWAQWEEIEQGSLDIHVVVREDLAYDLIVNEADTISAVKQKIENASYNYLKAVEFELEYNGNLPLAAESTLQSYGFGNGESLYVYRPVTYINTANNNESTGIFIQNNSQIWLDDSIFTRSGYTLVGWNTASDGNGTAYSIGDPVVVDAPLVLYAQWQESGPSSNVIYSIDVADIVKPLTGRTPSCTGSITTEGVTSGAIRWYHQVPPEDGDDEWYYVPMSATETYILNGNYKAVIPFTVKDGYSLCENYYWNLDVRVNCEIDNRYIVVNEETQGYELELYFYSVGFVDIDFSNIIEPIQTGQSPVSNWDFSGYHATASNIVWKDINTGTVMTSSDVFVDGHVYSLSLILTFEDGYYAGGMCKPNRCYTYDETRDPDNNTSTYSFTMVLPPRSGVNLIDSISFNMPSVPVAGNLASVDEVTVGTGLVLEDAYWYCNGTLSRVEPTDTFLPAHSYKLAVVVSAAEGYEFYICDKNIGLWRYDTDYDDIYDMRYYFNGDYAENFSVDVLEEGKVEIRIEDYYTEGYGENAIPLWNDLRVTSDYIPRAGETPELDILTFDTEKFHMVGTPVWGEVTDPVFEDDHSSRSSWRKLEEGETFQYGKYYMWSGQIAPEDRDLYQQGNYYRDWFVSNDDIYGSCGAFHTQKCEVVIVYFVGHKMADEMEVNVTYEPKAGEVPPVDIVTIDRDTYNVKDPFWAEIDGPPVNEGTYYSFTGQRMLNSGETLQAGKYYMWASQIYPVDEEEFSTSSGHRFDSLNAPCGVGDALHFFAKKCEMIVFFYVEDPTHLVTVSSTPIGHASGQGRYEPGDTVTVNVEGVDLNLYTFTGWFNGADFLSSDMSYSFTMGSSDMALKAVFSSNDGAKTILDVSADNFKINLTQGEVTEEYHEEVDLGTDVVISYEGEAEFLFWQNEGNKIVSTESTYEFTVGSQTTLSAVTTGEGSTPTTAKVMFLSAYKQILSVGNYGADTAVNEIEVPGDTVRPGYTFQGWKIEEDDTVYSSSDIGEAILNYLQDTSHLGKLIKINPDFERISGTFIVTTHFEGVEKEDKEDTFTEVGGYTVTTSDTVDDLPFSHWELNGKIISTDTSCPVYVSGDVELTAVYASEGSAPVETVPTLYRAALIDGGLDETTGKYRVTYMEMYNVPSGYTLVEHGVLYTKNEEYAVDSSSDLNLDSTLIGNGITKKTSVLKEAVGSYGMTFKLASVTEPRYVRAYLTYKDADGTIYTIYTDVEEITYETLGN